MTEPFPHEYEAALQWDGYYPALISAVNRQGIVVGPPPQFGGEGSWWSPEHLLISAANLCLMTTFLALAAKAQLKVLGYQSRARGILDKTKDGILFTRLELNVAVKASETDRERTEKLVHTAEKYCIVSNSLRVPVSVAIRVEAVETLMR